MLDRAQGNTFVHTFDIVDRQKVWYLEASCHRCGTIGRLKLNRKSTLSQEWADKGFAKEGWKVGPDNRTKDECPTCIQGEKVIRKARLEMAAPGVRDAPSEEEQFIIDWIGDKLNPPDENGERFFKHPWTEGAILRELVPLFPDLSLTRVQQLRAEHFGKITTKPHKPMSNADKIIEHLTHELQATMAVVARLQQRLDSLEKGQTVINTAMKDRIEELQTAVEEVEEEQDKLLERFESNPVEDIKAVAEANRHTVKAYRASKAANA